MGRRNILGDRNTFSLCKNNILGEGWDRLSGKGDILEVKDVFSTFFNVSYNTGRGFGRERRTFLGFTNSSHLLN